MYAKTSNVPVVYELGLDLFRDTVARSPRYHIQQHLRQVMLEQIQHEREGEVIDRSAVKSAVDMLLELVDQKHNDSVYVADFEETYLKTSAAFYKVESQMLVGGCDAPEYMKRVSGRVQELLSEYGRRGEEGGRTEGHCSLICDYYGGWGMCIDCSIKLANPVCIQVEKRLNEEQERTRHYLSGITEPKIRSIVEEELITNHVKTIMEV